MEEERNEKLQLLLNKPEKTLAHMWAGGGSLPTSEAGSLHHGIAAHGAQLGGRTEVKF